MEINRNNYEEYFLLYADNELSASDKKCVEIFLSENGDLRKELAWILEAVNIPDENITLADKSFLFKNEASFDLNEKNYEEIFVEYHDGELNEDQKRQTEIFLENNPRYLEEFNLIQKARLTADADIVYPDKKQLFRKEKSGKVIPIFVWRAMAAAVVLGFGIWISFSTLSPAKREEPIVKVEKSTKSLITPHEEVASNHDASIENAEVAVEPKASDVKPDKEVAAVPVNVSTTPKKDFKSNNFRLPVPSSSQEIAIEKYIPVKMPKVEKIITNEAVAENVESLTALNEKENVPNSHIDIEQNVVDVENVHPVSYLDNNNNQNYVFYNVTTEEFNKSKVGGFLKRVKRVVERSNPITRLLAGEDKQVAVK